MPYSIRRRKKRWYVYNAETGEWRPTGGYGTRREALAYLRALYVQADSPAELNEWSASILHKSADGWRYMLLVSSNAYQDREREYVSSAALAEDTEARWKDGQFVGPTPLMFWHDDPDRFPERIIGQIIWADLEGPFLIEVAREVKSGYATPIWDYIEAHPERDWGASVAFRYPKAFRQENTYRLIRKFETSVLPRADASNPLTFAGVWTMQAARDKLIDEIFGPGTAQKTREAVRRKKRALDDQGLTHKERTVSVHKAAEESLPDRATVAGQSESVDAAAGGAEKVDKALTVEQIADQIIAALAGEGEPAARRAALIDILRSLIDGSATGTSADAQAEADAEDMAATVRAQIHSLRNLNDVLLETQTDLVHGMLELRDMFSALNETSTSKARQGDAALERLEARLKLLEERFAGTPRAASQPPAMALDENTIKKQFQEAEIKRDPFWGVPLQASRE